jgi:hypothetical protein
MTGVTGKKAGRIRNSDGLDGVDCDNGDDD